VSSIFHKLSFILSINFDLFCDQKVRVQKSYSPYTTSCGPFLPCLANRSLIYWHLASPNSNCLLALSLICCNLKTDKLNHTTLYAIHIFDHVFQHKCIRENACILFIDYTHSESTGMFLQHKFLQNQRVWSFLKFLFLLYILYPSATWAQLPIRRSGKSQTKLSSLLQSSSLFSFLLSCSTPKIPLCL
jgi:hypothetical protein